ncbi:DUF6428 family protein [Flavobacterium agrisoli]|uniref:Uncharacterized protein n=1 Tax=Flavobacterium agrisoli TaxID=2793066 RepID=A0A934PN15_9FLAO|nr:DUF6428 family protein [Flavobacterium agrisoli]MBK0370210.1 hypothetical protein [Flavobacterium agrisoli]
MKLSDVKLALQKASTIQFQLPNGTLVPSHFHVTEVGKITKHFIDCGGTVRTENKANFQLWEANDYDHRLHPEKLISIIELAEKVLQLEDLEVEVEYQGETIQKFDLEFEGNTFTLISKKTDCLAKEKCGIPEPKATFSNNNDEPCCTPDGNCC